MKEPQKQLVIEEDRPAQAPDWNIKPPIQKQDQQESVDKEAEKIRQLVGMQQKDSVDSD